MLEGDRTAELNKLVLQWHCNAAQLTEWDEKAEQFEFHKRKAEETYDDIGKHLMPWLPRWNNAEGYKLMKQYQAFLDEEKKPEFRRWRDEIKSDMRTDLHQMAMAEAQAERAKVLKAAREREQQELKRKRAKRG